MMGYRFRTRSIKSIIDDILYLKRNYDIEEIAIVDDNFTFNKENAIKILNEIKELKMKVRFPNGLRIDKIDEEIIEILKETGCYTVGFGIETGTQKVLKMMKKKLNLETVTDLVKMCQKNELLVSGNWIIGYPGETEEDIYESMKYFMRLKLDSMAIVPCIPFPGTDARRICMENDWLTKTADNWDNYVMVFKNPIPLISTSVLSDEKLKAMIRKIFYKMYLDPVRLYKILRNINFSQMIRGFKILFR